MRKLVRQCIPQHLGHNVRVAADSSSTAQGQGKHDVILVELRFSRTKKHKLNRVETRRSLANQIATAANRGLNSVRSARRLPADGESRRAHKDLRGRSNPKPPAHPSRAVYQRKAPIAQSTVVSAPSRPQIQRLVQSAGHRGGNGEVAALRQQMQQFMRQVMQRLDSLSPAMASGGGRTATAQVQQSSPIPNWSNVVQSRRVDLPQSQPQPQVPMWPYRGQQQPAPATSAVAPQYPW